MLKFRCDRCGKEMQRREAWAIVLAPGAYAAEGAKEREQGLPLCPRQVSWRYLPGDIFYFPFPCGSPPSLFIPVLGAFSPL